MARLASHYTNKLRFRTVYEFLLAQDLLWEHNIRYYAYHSGTFGTYTIEIR